MTPKITTFRLYDGGYDWDQVSRQLEHMVSFVDNPNGCYDFILREHQNGRSISQNKYYWEMLHQLEADSGQSKDDWHDFLKEEHLSYYVTLKVSGKRRKMVRSTSELTVKQMTEYIEKCRATVLEYFPEFKFDLENDLNHGV